MTRTWIKPLFILAALYSSVLAVAFLLFAGPVLHWFGVEPPNHPAYLTFPALLLLVFAAMFVRVAGDPVKHRDLMLYGVGLKVAYVGTVFGYQLTSGIPAMWAMWAWPDLAFLVLFLIAWRSTGSAAGRPAA